MVVKGYIYTLVFGLISGLIISYCFLGMGKETIVPMEIMIFGLSGARGNLFVNLNVISLIQLSILMLPSMCFSLFEGKQVYRQFCIGSVYVMSRLGKRVKWYIREVIWLLTKISLFHISLSFSALFFATYKANIFFSNYCAKILIIHLLLQILWNYIICNLFSIIAISKEGNSAFLIVTGLNYLLLIILNIIPKVENIFFKGFLIHFNPFTHIVLCWQNLNTSRLFMGEPPFKISLIESILYLFLGCFFVVAVHYFVITKKEILLLDLEKEMI